MAMVVLFIILPFLNFSPLFLKDKENFFPISTTYHQMLFSKIEYVKNFLVYKFRFLSFFSDRGFPRPAGSGEA